MNRYINPNRFGAAQIARATDEVLAALERGQLFRFADDGGGSACDALEADAAAWLGVKGATAVSSGTAGLRVALLAVGVRPRDRVLVPAFTFIATAAVVTSAGAVPEPLDVGAGLGPDLHDLASRLHRGVRCVLAVHVQGHAVDLRDVAALLAARRIPLVEDACQGFGATCHTLPAGTVGDVGVFSFQHNKQLSSGEGGMVVARDPVLLERCRRLADLGAVRSRDSIPSWDSDEAILGENFRMTELQAAVLRKQLGDLDETLADQRERRARVRRGLDGHASRFVINSKDTSGDTASHLLLDIGGPAAAEQVIESACARGVLVRRVWDRPYYAHAVFARAGMTPGQLGVEPALLAERLAPCLVSVPTPGDISAAAADEVAATLNEALAPIRWRS